MELKDLPNPGVLRKYLYIERTPNWLVWSLYSFGLVAWAIVVFEFHYAVLFDSFFAYFVAPLLLILSIHYFFGFGINLFYRRFDLNSHLKKVKDFVSGSNRPTVDVFLPICGEEMHVVENTWAHVSALNYENKTVYVLDDSKENTDAYKKLSDKYGFIYLRRPNRGEMKKAGNLKYAFERSSSEFIAIFDADFAPHPDFLNETIPHTQDINVAIVQTPQYFIHGKTHSVEYGSAYVQEDFYRTRQMARDYFGGALCCGTNALYRRASLDTIGGPLQVPYSEDSRTGFALLSKGWSIKYIPVILAIGICPASSYTFFHQQHRWCSGSTELFLSKAFWTAPIKWTTKLCYLSGFLFYFHHPFSIILSFQLFYTLLFYNDYISFDGSLPFLPFVVFTFLVQPLYHIRPFRLSVFSAAMCQAYAYTHALITVIFGNSVGWISTNAKHSVVSKAFKQCLGIVAAYIFICVLILAIATEEGALHLFDLNYYSVQFWIFWNLGLTLVLLLQFYRSFAEIKWSMLKSDGRGIAPMLFWHARVAGVYILLLIITFFGIAML